MNSRILDKVVVEIDRIFQEEISEAFVYHNKAHTQSVVNNCEVFAQHYDLHQEERTLLAIAAWFHDTGYSLGYDNHEESSVKIARSFLQKLQLPSAEIEQIAACILATKVETPPGNLMEEIIKDADLANLGEDSFLDHSRRLRQEWLTLLNEHYSDKSWNELNLNFMSQHQYYTSVAQEKLGEKKLQNMNELKEKLQAL